MAKPDILLHQKHQIALEAIITEEVRKYMARGTKEKILDSAKQYGLALGVPNAIAGIIGYAADGPNGAVEAMKQVSSSVLPYSLALLAIRDILESRKPEGDINRVIKQTRASLTRVLRWVESQPVTMITAGIHAALSAGWFYSLSLLTEKLTGVDFNQAHMALAGAGMALTSSGITVYRGNQLRNRIADYAKSNVEKIHEKEGNRLGLEELEGIVRGAMGSPQKTYKICVASSEKRYRGGKGALGFFGAMDALADKDRDPTRVRPNVSLNLKSGLLEDKPASPQFTFAYEREKSKTETILEVARLAYAGCNGVRAEIHPMFLDAPLEDILSAPYEQLSAIHLHGRKDNAEYFEIKYQFYADEDNVEVTINSRQHLEIVLDLFKSLHGRSIKDVDFDSELVGMAKNNPAKPKSKSLVAYEDLAAELEKHNIDPGRFGLSRKKDLLEGLKPKKDKEYISHEGKEEKPAPEKPEQPLPGLDSLPDLVMSTYRANKDKILPSEGFPSLGIAFEGVVYSLTPIEYNKKEKTARRVIQVVASPLKTMRSLVSEGEALPSLREAELMAQVSGISRENVHKVIGALEERIKGLRVNPHMPSIDYETFWKIAQDPQLLADRAYKVSLTDGKGSQITLYFNEPQLSYRTIREEVFPSGEVLKAKAERIRQARKARDFDALSLFDMIGKSRFEKELEKPTYEVADGEVPAHVVMYEGNDNGPFIMNRTVYIETNDRIFRDRPVHPKEAVKRVTDYLSAVVEAVQEAGK